MNDALPAGLDQFLADAGWSGAEVEPLPGDASFRRYFRVRNGTSRAMLMDAPPPNEDPRPFLAVGKWLTGHGLRAPQIYAEHPEAGLVLLEDFGPDRMRDWLDEHPEDERRVYAQAVEALAELHRLPPGPFAPYALETYLRETALLPEWFCSAAGIEVDTIAFERAWTQVRTPAPRRHRAARLPRREHHAAAPGRSAWRRAGADRFPGRAGRPPRL
jgi:aminoglycoside/choline kinase family phosphotransferase